MQQPLQHQQQQQQEEQQPCCWADGSVVQLKLTPRTEQSQHAVRAAGHEPCVNLRVL